MDILHTATTGSEILVSGSMKDMPWFSSTIDMHAVLKFAKT